MIKKGFDMKNNTMYTTSIETYGERLHKARIKSPYTMKELADITGMTAQDISDIENKKRYQKEKEIRAIFYVMGIEIYDLLNQE